jgi:hypothetical protein
MKLRLCAIVLLCLAHASDAADLYKSIGPNGSVEFSDNAPGMPRVEPIYLDAEFERANLQLDLAERAFALARRTVSATPPAGHFTATRMSGSQLELIAFYQRNVVATRQVLAGVLQQKRLAAARGTLAIAAPAFHP